MSRCINIIFRNSTTPAINDIWKWASQCKKYIPIWIQDFPISRICEKFFLTGLLTYKSLIRTTMSYLKMNRYRCSDLKIIYEEKIHSNFEIHKPVPFESAFLSIYNLLLFSLFWSPDNELGISQNCILIYGTNCDICILSNIFVFLRQLESFSHTFEQYTF